MNLSGLETKTIEHNVTVLFCGVKLAEFHEISDDYAHTNAANWARLFADAWFKNDRMPMDERVNKSSAEAWGKLS